MGTRRSKCSVLKHNAVRLAGRRRLPGAGAAANGPQARAEIVGQDQTHVTIKVTCSCGEEIQLQCAYAPPAAAAS